MVELIFISLIAIVCLCSSSLFSRWGVPSLLVFIVLGMLFGSDGLFKIPLDDYHLVEQICSIALAFIMFYGGFGTNWKQARPVAAKAITLSTLGVVMTALITALFCRLVLRIGMLESFLIGAAISSTDAASVFSILRAKKLNLKYNTASLLEMESGSNDPASYMLTLTALSLLKGDAGGQLAVIMLLQIGMGIAVGIVAAIASSWVLRKQRLRIDGYDTLFVLALVVGAYALATHFGGNGYLAVYLFGIILGNSRIMDKVALVHFFDGITGQAQIIIFFLLGLLSFPSTLPGTLGISIAIAMFLTFVARPAAVFAILAPMKCNPKQILLVSFAGLRGAASIVFAIIAVVSGVKLEYDLFHIVFGVCLISVAMQGTLLPLVSRKLRMVDDKENVLKTFNDYQEDQQLQLIEETIPAEHPWIGRRLGEINIEMDVIVVMIIRGKTNIIPKGDTQIMAGDRLVFGGKPHWDTMATTLEEMQLDAQHPWEGKLIRDVSLSKEELVVLIRHEDGSTDIPHGNTVLLKGDSLVIRKVSL